MRPYHVNIPRLLLETFREWWEEKPSMFAAAIAYYAFFAAIPILVIATAIGSLFFGRAAIEGELASTLAYLFGQRNAEIIESAIANTYNASSDIVIMAAIAFLILGASYFFIQLRNAINHVWGIEQEKASIQGFVEGRLASLILVIGLSLLLLLWISASAALSAIVVSLTHQTAVEGFLIRAGDLAVLFSLFTLLFAMIYKLLPAVELTWKDVLLGSLFTSLFFTIGEYLLGLYFSAISISSIYGAAGSMVVMLLWLYMSAHIFFFGAVFTKVYARRHGSHKGKKKIPHKGVITRATKPRRR